MQVTMNDFFSNGSPASVIAANTDVLIPIMLWFWFSFVCGYLQKLRCDLGFSKHSKAF